MLFKLLCLYRKGIALSLSELAKAENHTGNLIIHDFQGGESLHDARRQARMLDPAATGKPYDLLPPLFDPVLVKMTEKQMTLQGFETHAEHGALVHYTQYWELRLVD